MLLPWREQSCFDISYRLLSVKKLKAHEPSCEICSLLFEQTQFANCWLSTPLSVTSRVCHMPCCKIAEQSSARADNETTVAKTAKLPAMTFIGATPLTSNTVRTDFAQCPSLNSTKT